jgi:hypothetical protein
MRTEVLPPDHAQIGIPDASQCLLFAAPFLGMAAVCWLFRHSDQLIDWLFPNWEWEKKLGWLNIRSSRRANAVLRWIGYAVYALLAFTLYGIAWGSLAFPDFAQGTPEAFADGVERLSALLACLGIWLAYLGFELVPQLRNQYEREELEKYRAEYPESDGEAAAKPAPRSSLTKIDVWSRNPVPPQRLRRDK